jgi:hypothetical protein
VSELVYVTTEDCHFCEHGRHVLDALGVARREIADGSDEAAALAERGIPLHQDEVAPYAAPPGGAPEGQGAGETSSASAES